MPTPALPEGCAQQQQRRQQDEELLAGVNVYELMVLSMFAERPPGPTAGEQ